MPTTSMAEALYRNAKPCKAVNCNIPRRNLGGYCRDHWRKAYVYGHPNGRSIRRKEYQRELNDVITLFNANPEHAGLLAATAWLDGLLYKASQGRAMVGCNLFRRLNTYGITGKKILIECSAIWLFSQRNLNTLDDDVRLTYALALVTLRLMPNERRTSWTSGREYSLKVPSSKVKAIGKSFRSTLCLFFGRVAQTMLQQDLEANKLKEAFFEPFQ